MQGENRAMNKVVCEYLRVAVAKIGHPGRLAGRNQSAERTNVSDRRPPGNGGLLQNQVGPWRSALGGIRR